MSDYRIHAQSNSPRSVELIMSAMRQVDQKRACPI